MATGLTGVALSGLNAAQVGIRTTQQNIANASTVGYRKQDVAYATEQPLYTGAGYVGNGVAIGGITHQYNLFLDNEVFLNQTQLARFQTSSDRAAQIDKLLGDSTTSLAPTIDKFFAAMQEVANDPASAMTRQHLLAAGNNLAGRFNTLGNKLQAYRTSSNDEMRALVQQVNTLAAQIAQANAGIAQTAQANGQLPNDLIDNRDKLIEDLNKLINVSRQDLGGGIVNVFIGSGQSLVSGVRAFTMGTAPSASDPSVLAPTINLGGTTLTLDASQITGGQMGGLLDYQQNVLKPAIASLNLVAMQMASAVNGQHRQGLDYNLAAGGDFFTNPVTSGVPGSAQLVLNANGAGAVDPVGYDLSFNGTQYTLTSLSTGATQTFATLAAVSANGLTFSVAAGSVAPASGDTWHVDTNYARVMQMAITTTDKIAAAAAGAGGPGNNGNMLALVALQASAQLNGGTSTLTQAYNQTVSSTAMLASQADLNRSAFQSLTDTSLAARQSEVGVNLDEEAAKLIQFQQAYQASARSIQVANSLFSEILNALR